MMSATTNCPRLPTICETCNGTGVLSPKAPTTSNGSLRAILRCGACLGHGVEVLPQDRDFCAEFTP